MTFWSELMSKRIDQLIANSELQGQELDVFRNQLVTRSYMELSEHPMAYVYANASHHLGRLVRYHFWKDYKGSELAQSDIELISGEVLGTLVRTMPRTLSKRLMDHSLDLYKTLSWSIAAENSCGKLHVKNMLKDSDASLVLLKEAFETTNRNEFVKKFIQFEQTYLQESMYSKPDIKIPASLGLLDKMRFIPFNGERHHSFYDWCKLTNCQETTLNLEKRIQFDQLVISQEFALTQYESRTHLNRLQNGRIQEVLEFIQEEFCHKGKLSSDFCQ